MQPQIRTLTFSDLSNDANGIAEDQTTGGAGNLVLDGALVTDGVATMGEAQIISIESAGNLSAVTFTVTGTDADGRVQVEAVTGPNAATVKTTEYFKIVTQIAVSAAVGTNVEVGPLAADGAASKTVGLDWRENPFAVGLSVTLTGTATFTVQHTFNDIQDFDNELIWFDNVGISGKTANTDGNLAFPVIASRLEITAFTSGAVTFTAIQAGGR